MYTVRYEVYYGDGINERCVYDETKRVNYYEDACAVYRNAIECANYDATEDNRIIVKMFANQRFRKGMAISLQDDELVETVLTH